MATRRLYRGVLNLSTSVWCKLIDDDELETFKTLEPSDPSSHRIASLVLPPYLLPSGHHLIAMPDYGYDLNAVNGRSLSGTRLHVITRQLIEAIQFLHSHNLCHLDIKPHNLAMDHRTSDLTVIDLGWVMYGKPPCMPQGSAGTYECVAPEVRKWFDWEETEEGDPPPLYDPWKVDAWAIGHTVRILMNKKEVVVDGWHELDEFSRWMMEDRPSMIKALERFDAVFKSVLDVSRQKRKIGRRIRSQVSLFFSFRVVYVPRLDVFSLNESTGYTQSGL
ncbi:hypothetical protein VNI00_013116 [Paramarasmius palmivorus]|uniref:Protein kinase domain-containing protein n=2 Tax=Paramarasmius palmivorus TaxID=297713 RepID=A0AAW0C083_9AGAR